MAFSGFPTGKVHHTPIPGPFFSELLPEIDHLGELKITLYTFWQLDRREGTLRYLRREDLAGDIRLMCGLGKTSSEAESTLDESLERAKARGTLLRVDMTQDDADGDTLYFLNSPRGRAAVEGLEQGKWRPEDLPTAPIELNQERPNIFRLYEAHIGPLTPMIADTLRDAEDTYPADWVEEATRIAVENNIRRWRYVEAILRSWQEEGLDERKDRPNSQKDRQKYVEGEFAEFVKH